MIAGPAPIGSLDSLCGRRGKGRQKASGPLSDFRPVHWHCAGPYL